MKTKMVTRSFVFAEQGPLATVQRNTLAPSAKPVTPLVGLPGVVMVPEPLTNVHAPLPGGISALPCKLVLVIGVHRLWSGPALAGNCAASNTRIVTCALLFGKVQGPFVTVHWNTFVPTDMPVMVVMGVFGEVMVPLPLTKVHTPLAGDTGVLPVTVTKFGEVGTQMLALPVAVTGGCVFWNTVIET